MLLVFMMSVAVSASAQTALVDNGTAKDNWYVGAGVGTNVWNNGSSWTIFNDKAPGGETSSWWRTQPLHIDVLVGKMFNPYVGVEIDYTGLFNLYKQSDFLDAHNLSANFVVNLTNLINGYDGARRTIELELIGGAGWLHNFNKDVIETDGVVVRGALSGNINLNKNFAITVTPEYVYTPKNVIDIATTKHGVNLSIGVKYRFNTKRGNFVKYKLYDQDEVNYLNSKINGLIATNENLSKVNSELSKANVDMAETINKLVDEGGKVKVKIQSLGTLSFKRGKADVDITKAEMIVTLLKQTSGTIILTGTTSPEGFEKVNKALAQKRAESVKEALVTNGVDESRIIIKNDYDNQRSVIISVNE